MSDWPFEDEDAPTAEELAEAEALDLTSIEQQADALRGRGSGAAGTARFM